MARARERERERESEKREQPRLFLPIQTPNISSPCVCVREFCLETRERRRDTLAIFTMPKRLSLWVDVVCAVRLIAGR